MVSLILRAVFSRDNQCIICITTDHFTLTAQQSSRQRKHWRQFKVKLGYEQTILEIVLINQTVNLCCTALHCGDEWIALVVEEVESKSKVESLDSPAATAPLHCPTTDQACNVLLTCSFSYFRQLFSTLLLSTALWKAPKLHLYTLTIVQSRNFSCASLSSSVWRCVL